MSKGNALSAAQLGLDRRGALAGFAAFALLGEVGTAAAGRRTSAARWIARQHEIAVALKRGEIAPRRWMREVEGLAREVDLAELMAAVARTRPVSAGAPAHNDPPKRYVRFVGEDGAPRRLGYGAALFDFAPHHVVTPHGHRNMVSAHLVVAGAVRVRNFDRVGDAPGAMVVRPTRDRVVRVGTVSTMSGEEDNIHWFVPVGGPATTFDVIISGIDPTLPDYQIKAIDPLGGHRRADGAIVAPILGFGDAAARYTADV